MARYEKGESGNKDGCPKGAHHEGRPPDWLREKCRDIVDKKQLVEFLGNVAAGSDMEQVVTESGVTIAVPASVKERIKAVEVLLNHGWVKDQSDAPQTPNDSVRNVEQAMKVLKQLETYGQRVRA